MYRISIDIFMHVLLTDASKCLSNVTSLKLSSSSMLPLSHRSTDVNMPFDNEKQQQGISDSAVSIHK